MVVIGAGFGGLAAGVKLREAGIETFTILERSLGVGGVWWDNRYPGVEVDVASHLYSYSFRSNDWSRTHARQAELQQYLEDTTDAHGLRPHLRLGVTVNEAIWDEGSHTWRVVLDGGDTLTCHVLISAVGFLNQPRIPQWPGLDDFTGPKFHTSRWEPEHDLTGKRIAVVGTGSTAAQLVPEIAPLAGQLFVFQREPAWVMEKVEREFTQEERVALRDPRNYRKRRLRNMWWMEKSVWRGALYRPGSRVSVDRETKARAYIDRVFVNRPDLRRAVTPTYPYPGKRPIFHSTFYPSLLRDNVELVPKAVAAITPTGIVDVDGVERQIDVLIMATGFEAANYLPTIRISGRRGRTLHDVWAGEPYAFLGITVPGFPNFGMLYGPNTNGGEIVTNLERQAEFMVRIARRLRRSRVTAVETRSWWCRRYNGWLQKQMEGTSWTMTRTYYASDSGRIVTQWPYGSVYYSLLTKSLGRISERATRARASGKPRSSSRASSGSSEREGIGVV